MPGKKRNSVTKTLSTFLGRSTRVSDPLPRLSSFPFISGDTFRLMCGYEFSLGSIRTFSPLNSRAVFVDTLTATAPQFLRSLESAMDGIDGDRPDILVVHNGDSVPSMEQFDSFAQLFQRIYCVNVVAETRQLRAIPIGLENSVLNRNGKLGGYLDNLAHLPLSEKRRRVLASFHVESSPSRRAGVAESLRRSRHGFQGVRWKRGDYQKEVRSSMFVVSPPGNGLDCHRTWEAVVLGAVPVVLKSALAESLWRDMPVFAVDSYQDFLSLTDSELDQWFVKLSRRAPRVALARHWIEELSA